MDLGTTLTSIVVPLASFLLAGGIVVGALYAKHRARQMRYDAIRHAIEKGQPVPEDLLRGTERQGTRNDLQRGVILTFLGVGISLFLWFKQNPNWAAGLVLVALGLGYLVAHAVRPKEAPGSGKE